jgi:hypothetical protein
MFGRAYLLTITVQSKEGFTEESLWCSSFEEVDQIVQKAKKEANTVTYSLVTDDEFFG